MFLLFALLTSQQQTAARRGMPAGAADQRRGHLDDELGELLRDCLAFRVTPQLLLSGLVFAVMMGVVGGFFPARRASRLPVIQALR